MVIERFFISIKAEIDREIKNLEEKERKKGKRTLSCDTGATRSSQGLHKSTSGNAISSASAHQSVKYPQNSYDYLSTTQSQCVRNSNGITMSYPYMHEQHHPGYASPHSQTGQLAYQSKVMNASGYMGQQQGYMNNQEHFNRRLDQGQARNNSFEYSQKSLDLSQTQSETEIRLAKLHYEVAGLVSRYQVAEDELQSAGHSIGTSTNGKEDRRNSYGTVEMRNVDDPSRIDRGVYQENRGNQHVPYYATPPRKPLEHRLNHLHDVTPPRLSYSQQRMTPTQPPHQHQLQHNSFHAPVPMRHTHSNPHLCQSASGRESPQMHYSNQRFPPIPSASQSNLGVKILQSNNTFDSNSPRITRQNSFGQSTMIRRSSQQEHQNHGIPRTPSGRQF